MNKKTEHNVKKILNSFDEIDEDTCQMADNAEVGLEVVHDLFQGYPDLQKILDDAQTICGLVVGRSRKLH